MKTLGALEATMTTVAVCLLLVLLISMPIDISSFLDDKLTYALVYNYDTNEENWEWHYLSRWVYLSIFVIIGLMVTILRLTKQDNRLIEKINQVFLCVFFCSIIFGFYSWMQVGFDH